jgi:lipopolysaccharide export system ATP-binding protein
MRGSLKAAGLEKSYGRKKVVDGISVEVRRGEIVGLLGPNGAGKTTTFSIMAGLIPGDGGRIDLDGEDITGLPMYLRARKGISLLPQEPSIFRKLTVEGNILAVIEARPDAFRDRPRDPRDILEEFGLARLSRAKAYTLSGGERRRLEIARAMVTSPDFILLDEPFTGIDPLAVLDLQDILKQLKEKRMGILVTDHNVRETLEITDKACIIDKGKMILEGTPRDILSSREVRESYLGSEFRL